MKANATEKKGFPFIVFRKRECCACYPHSNSYFAFNVVPVQTTTVIIICSPYPIPTHKSLPPIGIQTAERVHPINKSNNNDSLLLLCSVFNVQCLMSLCLITSEKWKRLRKLRGTCIGRMWIVVDCCGLY